MTTNIKCYDDALTVLRGIPGPKEKKLEPHTRLWAEGDILSGNVWTADIDAEHKPVRIHVSYHATNIVTYMSGGSGIELNGKYATRTTLERIQRYTPFRLWTSKGFVFIQGLAGNPLPFQLTNRLSPDGRIGGRYEWMNAYDIHALSLKAESVAHAHVSALLRGRLHNGWDVPLRRGIWRLSDIISTASTIVENVYQYTRNKELNVRLLLALLTYTNSEVDNYRQLIASCYPDTYAKTWRMRSKLDRISANLSGGRMIDGRLLRHPTDVKYALMHAATEGLLTALQLR